MVEPRSTGRERGIATHHRPCCPGRIRRSPRHPLAAGLSERAHKDALTALMTLLSIYIDNAKASLAMETIRQVHSPGEYFVSSLVESGLLA